MRTQKDVVQQRLELIARCQRPGMSGMEKAGLFGAISGVLLALLTMWLVPSHDAGPGTMAAKLFTVGVVLVLVSLLTFAAGRLTR